MATVYNVQMTIVSEFCSYSTEKLQKLLEEKVAEIGIRETCSKVILSEIKVGKIR